jgi:hypothetical protein
MTIEVPELTPCADRLRRLAAAGTVVRDMNLLDDEY